MPRNDRGNLSVKMEVLERVKKKYENSSKAKDISFTSWVSEKLLLTLEQEDYITQSYAPYLNTEAIHDNYVILRDERIKKLVEVRFQNEKMQCSEDEGECCPHIHFVFALPELVGFFRKHQYLKKTRPAKE